MEVKGEFKVRQVLGRQSDQIQYIMAGNRFLGDELCDAPSIWPALGHRKSSYHLTYYVVLSHNSLGGNGCYTLHYYS